MTRTRYTATRIQAGRVHLTEAPGVDAKELKNYGGRWLPSARCWTIPARWQDIELLRHEGISIDIPQVLLDALTEYVPLDDFLQKAESLRAAPDHPAWERLMPHQRVGVAYLTSRERALLAFTPGLGKTATAIVAADVKQYRRILVVAPLTLRKTWEHEIQLWATDASLSDKPGDARWTIVNPEKVTARRSKDSENAAVLKAPYDGLSWDLVIMDESILYKSRTAKRTRAMARLGAGHSDNVWLLSGSPVAAYADDLFSQMQILRPDVFTSYWRFAGQWCQLEQTPWATKVVGNRAAERLTGYLRDIMISRTPEDVKLLPEAVFETVYVGLSDAQVESLRQLRENGIAVVNGQPEVCDNVLAQLTRAAQIVSCPRQLDSAAEIGPKLETLRDMLEWAPLPAIVWTQFKATAQAAAELLRQKGQRVGVLQGDTPKSERGALVDAFQSGELDVLIIQLQTGKFGLSLTAAKSAIFVDRSYSSDDWIQAIARVRRLSSTESVPNYVLHAGSIDILVDQILSKKLHSIQDLQLSDLAKYL